MVVEDLPEAAGDRLLQSFGGESVVIALTCASSSRYGRWHVGPERVRQILSFYFHVTGHGTVRRPGRA